MATSMSGASVVVIGGGAAGLVAAISAARNGAEVLVLEAAKRVGQKILKTGNGRCNLSNADVRPVDYNDPAFVSDILATHDASSVLEFFASIGLLTVEEEEGRIYPLSNAASSVLDVLRDACGRLGIEIACEREVVDIRLSENSYELKCKDGASVIAERVVVTTGGATKLLECLGHAIAPFQPVLCPIKTESQCLKGLSGVRAHARVRAFHANEQESYFDQIGEVLFRDNGISGIVSFDLSRYVASGDTISLDFLPGRPVQDYIDWLNGRYALLCICDSKPSEASVTYAELMCGSFHPRVNNVILQQAGLKPSLSAEAEKLSGIARTAKDFRLKALGIGDAKRAQVTRGGAVVDEFDSFTLESRLAPGVFAAGETLNVDGRCGGFNLHWAWASGMAAGAAASRFEG